MAAVSSANAAVAATAHGAAANLPPAGFMVAHVKRVLSGDTVVVCPTRDPSQERSLSLALLSAPRFNGFNSKTAPQPWGFEAREILRRTLVGRDVFFRIEYTATSTGRDFCTIKVRAPTGHLLNVASVVLESGLSRLRENPREVTGEQAENLLNELEVLKLVEENARALRCGVWDEANVAPSTTFNFVEDPRNFLRINRGKQLPAVVEAVCSNGSLQARVIISSEEHSLAFLSLAGVKVCCENDGNVIGFAAKNFIEKRLLQREVFVVPEYVDGNNICASVIHPKGNIVTLLLQEGLARTLEWGLNSMSSKTHHEAYAAAEAVARERRCNIWEGDVESMPSVVAARLKGAFAEPVFSGNVTKIIAPDVIAVRSSASGTEYRISFASLRGPRKDTQKQIFDLAKEWLRSRLIGSTVEVAVDYIRPPQNDFEERICATVTAFREKKGKDVAFSVSEELVRLGYALVVRHRREENSRASNYNALLEAEALAQSGGRGLHSNKQQPSAGAEGGAASGGVNAAAAGIREIKTDGEFKPVKTLPILQRLKGAPGIIDYVFSASRFSIILPRDNWKFVMMLTGIRAPRKNEKWGEEAYQKMCDIAFQRDCSVEIDSTDKNGSFIGSLKVGDNDLSVALVESGLASVHHGSAQTLASYSALCRAEESAKAAAIHIWQGFDAKVEEEKRLKARADAEHRRNTKITVPRSPAFLMISDYRDPFRFYVQSISDRDSIEEFAKKFNAYHATAEAAKTAVASVKRDELVSARFSVDGCWYRGLIQKIVSSGSGSSAASKATATAPAPAAAKITKVEVFYVDYGNVEVLPITSLRKLPEEFQTVPRRAVEAQLSFLNPQKLARAPEGGSGGSGKEGGAGGSSSSSAIGSDDFASEMLDKFCRLTAKKTLLANLDTQQTPLQLTLFDPDTALRVESSPTGISLATSINCQLLREGCALLDMRTVKKHDDSYMEPLIEAQQHARENRLCVWQYGDIFDEDDE